MISNLRCLVYVNKVKSNNTAKGQAKLCSTDYIKDMCRCENCKACNRLTKNIYRKNNLEKMREYQKEYRKNNSEKIKKYSYAKKVRLIKNIDQYKQKCKEYNHRYKSKNPEKIKQMWREKDRRRRANIKQNGFERYTEAEVLKKYGTICYLCNIEIDMDATRLIGKMGWESSLHIEHVVDIAKGGPDTLENVRPSHAVCNLTKKPTEMV